MAVVLVSASMIACGQHMYGSFVQLIVSMLPSCWQLVLRQISAVFLISTISMTTTILMTDWPTFIEDLDNSLTDDYQLLVRLSELVS